MSHDQGPEKLIRMANQIATFFMSQPEKVRVEGVATHINKFWEPRMRRQLFAHLDHGGEGLMTLVVDASALIKRPLAQQAADMANGGRASDEPTGGDAPVAGLSLAQRGAPTPS
jgi:formate dehydrogenase subunit delta